MAQELPQVSRKTDGRPEDLYGVSGLICEVSMHFVRFYTASVFLDAIDAEPFGTAWSREEEGTWCT